MTTQESKSGPVTVVVGGQFGSEAKGHVTAKLAAESARVVMVVRVGGPNAGHSAIGVLDNLKYSLRQVPVAAVTRLDCKLVIGEGSEVEPDVLFEEVAMLDAAGYRVSERLYVDASATVIQSQHKVLEGQLVGDIGSTGKGVGAARAEHIMRTAVLLGEFLSGTREHKFEIVTFSSLVIRRWLQDGGKVIIEGTQGYGLGLHAGEYPYCTSSDCRAIDFLAMAGISPWAPEVSNLSVWVVLRTFPIRVAGNSGVLEDEKTWEEMRNITGIEDLQPELTTVTQKVRRVGGFDWVRAKRAVIGNGTNVNIALTFMDYIDPGLVEIGKLSHVGEQFISKVQSMLGAPVKMITWSPSDSSYVAVNGLSGSVSMPDTRLPFEVRKGGY